MIRAKIAKHIPQSIVNSTLLTFPSLYKSKIVMYESYLSSCISFLEKCIDDTEGLDGDIIECGCARCGTSAILAKKLKSMNSIRKIYALDSFGEGFDRNDLRREIESGAETPSKEEAFHYNSYSYVLKKIRKLELDDIIFPVKGFFSSTLPKTGNLFSLALIDCDLGTTIKFCLEEIFPRLVSKGIILVDEYGSYWSGVKPAVDSFLAEHERVKRNLELHPIIIQKE